MRSELWLDHVTVVRSSEPAPVTEASIFDALGPVVQALPKPPGMVIDGRPASARPGPTATYRLLAALGLVTAAPLALSIVDQLGAFGALSLAVRICPSDTVALLVTTGGDGPTLVGCATVSPRPQSATAFAPSRPAPGTGGGFIDLLMICEDTRRGSND